MKVFSKMLLACAVMLSSLTTSAATLDIGTASGSGCCSFGTRGYWFVAPTEFTITSLFLPTQSVSNSTLEVLRFNSTPPTWGGTTNDFVSLGFWEDVASVNTNISVQTGQIIGILGWADGFTPYRNANGDYNTTIDGFNTTLNRLGFQFLGQAHDVWNEEGTIGFIGMTYSTGSQVPEPSALLLSGLALSALWISSKRKQV